MAETTHTIYDKNTGKIRCVFSGPAGSIAHQVGQDEDVLVGAYCPGTFTVDTARKEVVEIAKAEAEERPVEQLRGAEYAQVMIGDQLDELWRLMEVVLEKNQWPASAVAMRQRLLGIKQKYPKK